MSVLNLIERCADVTVLPPFLDVVHLSVCLFVCCFELSVLNWILILNYLSVVLSCCPDELESSMSVVLNCPLSCGCHTRNYQSYFWHVPPHHRPKGSGLSPTKTESGSVWQPITVFKNKRGKPFGKTFTRSYDEVTDVTSKSV